MRDINPYLRELVPRAGMMLTGPRLALRKLRNTSHGGGDEPSSAFLRLF